MITSILFTIVSIATSMITTVMGLVSCGIVGQDLKFGCSCWTYVGMFLCKGEHSS